MSPERWSSRLWREQAGQASVEYVLLVVTFGIPMILGVRWFLGVLGGYYGMLTFFETMPLP